MKIKIILILVVLNLFLIKGAVMAGNLIDTKVKTIFQEGDFEIQVNQNYKKAISLYKKGLKKDPKSDIAYSRISHAFFMMNKTSEAIKNINKAIELDPQQPYHHLLLGTYYRKEKKISEAIRSFNKSLEVAKEASIKKWDDSNIYSLYAHLGSIYLNEKRYDKAISFFNKAISKDNNIDMYAYYCLGLSYLKMNNLEKANEFFLMINSQDRGYLNSAFELYGYDVEKVNF